MRCIEIIAALMISVISACANDGGIVAPEEDDSPVVKNEAFYEVIVETDITYAEGLSHDSWNGPNVTTLPLKLDVYRPNNAPGSRPLFLFVHGGGFSGGSKQQSQIVTIANFFASRGWVFVSVDYRLQNDLGSVPQEWVDVATGSPDSSQFLAVYPAIRDAKAALRWTIANAASYDINTDFVTVGGGSAGAIAALAIGVSELQDYNNELSPTQDPSLSSTHSNQSYVVHAIVDFWGSKVAIDALEMLYGHRRFDAGDPPLLIVHGTEDPTVPYSSATALKTIYEDLDIPLAFYPAEGAGHGIWNYQFDGRRLEELVFDFLLEQLGLVAE